MSTKADGGFIDDRAVWIHSYRFSHSRRLSDQELLGIQKEARRQRALAVQAGVGSFLMAMLAIGSLVSISLMPVVFWSFFALSIVAFLWLLNLAGNREKLSLLFRRSMRVGQVDRYELGNRPRKNVTTIRDSDEGPEAEFFLWKDDEEFEEALMEMFGMRPQFIETPYDDDVLLSANGKFVPKIIGCIRARL